MHTDRAHYTCAQSQVGAMSKPIEVRKASLSVQVNVVDGVPQCPCHLEPMVQVESGEWLCEMTNILLSHMDQVSVQGPRVHR